MIAALDGAQRRADARGGVSSRVLRRGGRGLPLSALLSQALVAFTIELDNEFEHRMPHSTTREGSKGAGPWLGSLVLWSNCLQYVEPGGITVEQLSRLAGARTNLAGMRRWGYVKLQRVDGDEVIRPTRAGRRGWGARSRAVGASVRRAADR